MKMGNQTPRPRRCRPSFTWLWLCCCLATQTAAAPESLPHLSNADIGAVGIGGHFALEDEAITVHGSGADIWGEADSFHYVYVPWDGDGRLIARVVSIEQTDRWAKAGLMFRETLAEGSRHALIAMTPEQGAAFLRRAQPNQRTLDDAHQAMRAIPGHRGIGFQQRGSAGADKAEGSLVASHTPRWIKIVRQGDIFSAFDSDDGHAWEWLGTDRLPMNRSLYAGLAVTSHDHFQSCAAVFDQLRLEPLGPDALTAPEPSGARQGQGLKGAYFNSRDHSGPALERIDPVIDFDWGFEAPLDGVNPDQFTVRWEGELEAPFTEPFALHVISDDRARLWLDGELVIDEWHEHAEARSAAIVNLEAGRRYLLRLDYFENRGRALVRLEWSSPSLPLQVIPQFYLYPAISDRDGDGLPDLWEILEGLDPDDPADADLLSADRKLTHRQKYQARFATTLRPFPKTGLPAPWLHQDIGRAGIEGEAALLDGKWLVRGSGADIWAHSDGFHFLYQSLRGNGEISARVLSQEPTDPWARAGVMIREDIHAESRHVMAALTPEHGTLFLHRHQTAGSTTLDQARAGHDPVWLKLLRQDNLFSCFHSPDGLNWQWIGTEQLELPEELLFGLAVNSHDNSALGAALFDQVTVKKLPQGGKPARPKPGSGTGLQAHYFDSLTGAFLTRVDPAIDFDWGRGSPADGIGSDFFTARWEGSLEPLADGLHALHVLTDDGARLWLDGTLLIDAWNDRAATLSTAQVELKAGRRYSIRMEFYEREGEAMAQLLWSTPATPKQIIPQTQLYPPESHELAGLPADLPPLDQAHDHSHHGPDSSSHGQTLEHADHHPPSASWKGIEGVTTILEIPPASAVDLLGQWQSDGPEIFALSRRGALEYELPIPLPDIYQIEIEGVSNEPFDLDSGFYLIVSLEGEHLQRTLLDAGPNRPGQARLLTPYLAAGTCRLRIDWDNARKGRSLRLKMIRLQVLEGPDSDGNGIKDWVESKLESENGIDSVDAADRIESLISPACIEGRGRFLTMMKITANGELIQPQHGAGDRWFANIPLAEARETLLEVSFQNGGRVQRANLAWRPVDPLTGGNLVIREGDALLLGAAETAPGAVTEFAIGQSVRSTRPGQALSHQFSSPGNFELRKTSSPPGGNSLQVQVLSGKFPEPAAAWVGRPRFFDCPELPREAVIEADPRISIRALAQSSERGRTFRLTLDAPEPRFLLARAGPQGPILAGARIDGFNVYSASATDLAVIETLSDRSQLIEMGIVLSPLLPQLRFEVSLIVGGVVFEDGTVAKEWTALDMAPLGETSIRFFRPANVPTSVCHRLKIWEAGELLGIY